MSKAYYIASDFQLPEVNYTGVKKETLKNIKKNNPLLQFPNWMSQVYRDDFFHYRSLLPLQIN